MNYLRQDVGVGKMYTDRRMGGVERRSLGKPEGFDLRVPDGIRDCTAYILETTRTGDRDEPSGTAFFVSVESDVLGPEVRHTYLVTAQHVANSGGLSLSFNDRDGKRHEPVPLPNASQWYRLEDEGVDVAALLLDDDYGWLAEVAYEPVPLENTFDSKMIKDSDIGIGDELLVTGLLVSHPGAEKNIPIVRSGIIAAMAGDELRDYEKGKYGLPYKAHLVELRSTGGLSGSPVFVVIGPARPVFMQSSTIWDTAGGVGMVSWRLLGLIRGHFKERPGTGAGKDTSANAMYDSDEEGINRGIAKVIPSQYIRELLLTGKPKADRIERDKKRPPRDMDALDAAPSENFSRADYQSALKKVSRKAKPPPPEQASSGT